MNTKVGFQAKALGLILAPKLRLSTEDVIIHHITNFESHIQIELERRYPDKVSFERVKLTEYSATVMHSFVHRFVANSSKPDVVKQIAVWELSSGEIMTVRVTAHPESFERRINEHKNMKFIEWREG
jgi:hypothetical protein